VRFIERPGINLIIYDQQHFQVALKRRRGSSEKQGVAVHNRLVTSFMIDYFDLLWRRAGRVVSGG